MSQFRADLWVSAFVRRHNDIGHFCVVSRRGDPVAGQIFIEQDHLNGSVSLYAPAPSAALPEGSVDRVFQRRFNRATPGEVRDRLAREADFDPDFWVISVDLRGDDLGIDLVG